MSEYYHIVPWYNSEEWLNVYENLFSQSSTFLTKQEGLECLLIWKARNPSLPSGIESTLTLLEVYMQDEKNADKIVNDHLLRLAYSSAIMRFVNHMLDTEAAKGSSLYQAARNLGVPDWIIDLRHDTAHSNNLPTIELLREASIISLEWLRVNYWDKYKQYIKDYISGQVEIDTNEENKITVLMNFCISLSFCAHSKIGNLAKIPDSIMRESIVNDAIELLGEQIDLSKLKTVSINALINTLNSHSKKLLKTKDTAAYINKALLNEDSLFLSLDLVNYMSDNGFTRKNNLNINYVQCFEVLLTFLHSNTLLQDFILELIKLTQDNESDNQKRRLAALWISEILKAINKSKKFMNITRKFESLTSKSKKELKQLYHHWFPNEKTSGLFLDLQKQVPSDLMNINFIQPIISSYNPYLIYFIEDMLNLVEPSLPKSTIQNICSLALLISTPDKFPATSSQIYTMEDLEVVAKSKSVTVLELDEENDYFIEKSLEEEDLIKEVNPNTIWRSASTQCQWSQCPIGVLPWQQNNCREEGSALVQNEIK